MALLHQAELRPSKLELVGGWAPSQPWFAGDASSELTSVGAYRFDDPAGEVGVETLLVRAGDGPVMQLPLTYRGVPLAGADEWLIGTLQHSVLGTRWVYDGAGDPVYLEAVATAIVTGGSQAELYIEIDGERVQREPTAKVSGSGMDLPVPGPLEVEELAVQVEHGVTVVKAGALSLVIPRQLPATPPPHDDDSTIGVLTGTWAGQPEPQPLVFAAQGQAAQ